MLKMTKQEFYDSIDEWISAPREKWNHVTFVAYFHHKYFQKNGTHFATLRWNGNPASSKECRDMAKIFEIFASEDYKELPSDLKQLEKERVNRKIYSYINWMFDYKHRYGDKGLAITTQFFLAPYSINEFQIMYDKALKQKSSTATIEELIIWCKNEMPEVLNEHQISRPEDIKLIDKYADLYKLPDSSNERKLVSKAIAMGIVK